MLLTELRHTPWLTDSTLAVWAALGLAGCVFSSILLAVVHDSITITTMADLDLGTVFVLTLSHLLGVPPIEAFSS